MINLKEQLRKNNEVERPSNFHERNELYLPKENSLVKSHLNKLKEYVDMEGMEIQHKRTCIQTFNISQKHDFVPKLDFDNKDLEVVYSNRVLGIIITSNCKFDAHVNKMLAKPNKKLWFLQRLKSLGASEGMLTEIYCLFVR